MGNSPMYTGPPAAPVAGGPRGYDASGRPIQAAKPQPPPYRPAAPTGAYQRPSYLPGPRHQANPANPAFPIQSYSASPTYLQGGRPQRMPQVAAAPTYAAPAPAPVYAAPRFAPPHPGYGGYGYAPTYVQQGRSPVAAAAALDAADGVMDGRYFGSNIAVPTQGYAGYPGYAPGYPGYAPTYMAQGRSPFAAAAALDAADGVMDGRFFGANIAVPTQGYAGYPVGQAQAPAYVPPARYVPAPAVTPTVAGSNAQSWSPTYSVEYTMPPTPAGQAYAQEMGASSVTMASGTQQAYLGPASAQALVGAPVSGYLTSPAYAPQTFAPAPAVFGAAPAQTFMPAYNPAFGTVSIA